MKRTVMIVDDSATMRSLILTYLMEIGDFETLEAKSGFEALKLLPTRDVDLILTDINMPDIDGLELLNFIKSSPIYNHVPTIIITTERGEADRRRGLALGARAYIVKPFYLEELREAVAGIFPEEGLQ